MSVELLWVTPNAEQIITYCARVSSPQNQTKSGDKLLRYLLSHKHVSPFEMASMAVSIKTSRAISAQILRHRSFHFQEFSQRFSAVQSFESIHPRRQDTVNRQNSFEDLDDTTKQWFQIRWDKLQQEIQSLYTDSLNAGIAKESARFILPMCSSTHMYMTGTVRDFIYYIAVRTDETAQKEHRDIANQIKQIFMKEFPIVSSALGWQEVLP